MNDEKHSEDNGTLNPKVPGDDKDAPDRQIAIARTEFAATYHSGPLPPAILLEQYERICPGAADRIIMMAEKEADHRHDIEQGYLKDSVITSRLGIIMAAIICISSLVGGVIVILNGHNWPGSILGTSGLVGLAGTFVHGTNSRWNYNKTEKNE